MGITRQGLEYFYLKGKEDQESVPREALVEAIALIDEVYLDQEKMNRYVCAMMGKIQPVVSFEESKLMIVAEDGVALHRTGLFRVVKGEAIAVRGSSSHFYCGIAYYSCFVDVYFPNELLREPTPEEVVEWGQ